MSSGVQPVFNLNEKTGGRSRSETPPSSCSGVYRSSTYRYGTYYPYYLVIS